MEGPGRKSSASLTVLPPPVAQRPEPFPGLNSRQKRMWREIVNARHVDWFPPDVCPLLAEYVRGIDAGNLLGKRIDAAISAASPDDELLKTLLDMRDKESRRITSIATKLRLTNQSRYTPQAAGTAAKKSQAKRPWAG